MVVLMAATTAALKVVLTDIVMAVSKDVPSAVRKDELSETLAVDKMEILMDE
jgi:hypothetical protein